MFLPFATGAIWRAKKPGDGNKAKRKKTEKYNWPPIAR
jgi:hypothetical protein